MNDAIVHFVLGSSPIITIFPFLCLANAYEDLTVEEKEESKISPTTLFIVLPILYGVLFAIIYNLLEIIPRKIRNDYMRFVVCGALAASLVSVILHYALNIYHHWFKIENPLMFHVGVFIFYLGVFYTVGQWVRAQVLYGPPKPKSVKQILSPPSSSTPSSLKFDQIKTKAAAIQEN